MKPGFRSPPRNRRVAYLADGRAALGVLPTQDTIVLERFFDESGGMQLVLHAPFGSRVNKAWSLALRKRFCRQFNFELQAAATEDALLLSLGPQHSFPLADVFRYLHPATTRDVLVQAFLDAPVFQTRWRWNTTISLAVPRNRGGKKVPPQLQRMLADDLMAAVFPDAAACLENIPGDRDDPRSSAGQPGGARLPGRSDGLRCAGRGARRGSTAGEIRCVARDTPEPSALAHEILNARPYAFMDDAPLEERRTQAVYARRAGEPSGADDLGALDTAAIERVRDEARPDPRDADELHDALLTAGFLTRDEARPLAPELMRILLRASRATTFGIGNPAGGLLVAAERLPELRAVHPEAVSEPSIEPPASRDHPRLEPRSGDRRAAARARRHRRTDDCASARRRARDCDEPTPTRRYSRSNRKAWCSAVPFPHPRPGSPEPETMFTRPWSGAIGGCWRGSIATRCIGCGRRSSRSARPISCGSCSTGSTWRHRAD